MKVNRSAFWRALTAVTACAGLLTVVNCAKQTSPVGQHSGVSVRGILNGQALNAQNATTLGPVLGLQINQSALCSATHLGNGYILTAWHCIGLEMQQNHGQKPTLVVVSPTLDSPIGPLRGEDYDVFFPQAEDHQTAHEDGGGTITVPQPDLSLVHLKGAAAKELSDSVAAVSIPATALNTGDENLTIGGYGQQGLGHDAAAGALETGKADLVEVDKLIYVLDYKPGSDNSSALPGDSGGPLFRYGSNGLEQFGVASSVAIETDKNQPNGNNGNNDSDPFPSLFAGHSLELMLKPRVSSAAPELKEAFSLYVRIDRAPVHDWLTQELSAQ